MGGRVHRERPFVLYNVAVTADGKVATVDGDSRVSGREDLVEVHRLRAEFDAVAVGVNTVLADDPMLNVRLVDGEDPIRVVFDSRCRTPADSRLVKTAGSIPTVIYCSDVAPEDRVRELEEAGVDVHRVGEERVDVAAALRHLAREYGVERLLLEGGPTLAWSFFKEGLVDEVRMAIAPVMVGGSEAPTALEGEGFSEVVNGVALELTSVEKLGRDVILRFKVGGDAGSLAEEHESARSRG